LQVSNTCDISKMTQYEFHFVASNCNYEYNSIVITNTNIESLKRNPRMCRLTQNIGPVVSL